MHFRTAHLSVLFLFFGFGLFVLFYYLFSNKLTSHQSYFGISHTDNSQISSNQTNKLIGVQDTSVHESRIEGNSMFPMYSSGDIVTIVNGYYSGSNIPLKGDIITYSYNGNPLPLIKKIMVTDSDQVSISSTGSSLLLNGEPLKNSVGDVYVFSSPELQMLSIYISSGKIPKNSYFIFGDNVQDSIDSRKFGAVSIVDIQGKVLR